MLLEKLYKRFDTSKKSTRGQKQKITHEQLVEAVSGDTYRTLQSIGDEFGVTRERVRQLLNKYNLTQAPARQIPDKRKTCAYCTTIVEPIAAKTGGNPKIYPGAHASCSREYRDNLWATIPCNQCNTDIRIRKSDARLKRRKMEYLFCGHRCSAKYRIENETDDFGAWAKGSKKSHSYFQTPRNRSRITRKR
tara:strand:+ start:235 stop:810 length:576 start_codon:yes stop_codon:yes gene_type:complete